MPLCTTCHGRAALHDVTHPGASPVPCLDCNGTGQSYAAAEPIYSDPAPAPAPVEAVVETPIEDGAASVE